MYIKEITKKEIFKVSRMGTLYLLDNDNILKIFKEPKRLHEIDKYKYMLKYINESFIFPFEFIYDSEKFYGYITKRATGKTLDLIFSQSNLIELSNNSKNFESNLDYVSKGGIILSDFHSSNMIYDGKKITAIDPDDNDIYRSISEATSTNQYYHKLEICKLFDANIENNKHMKLVKDNISKYKYGKFRPSEIILKVKEDIEGITKEEINTIDDVNNIFRM